MKRCHDAIDRAIDNLGFKWVFPSSVSEKQTQVEFEVQNGSVDPRDTSNTNLNQFQKDIDSNGYVISSCKPELMWYSKNLNERQKMAVINVLKGQGRPLPYIVFGPPGTGKTSTLIELIIQIYSLIPGSRLLVCAPLNSAADLICERLIEIGKFKPGQLVRLIAFQRFLQDKVPPKLVPYSTLGKKSFCHFHSLILFFLSH